MYNSILTIYSERFVSLAHKAGVSIGVLYHTSVYIAIIVDLCPEGRCHGFRLILSRDVGVTLVTVCEVLFIMLP